jgi:dTDP-4-dehydrorhamnose reductase
MIRILLTGVNGQVGWELQRTLAPLGHVNALGRNDLDLTSPHQLRQAIHGFKPDIIINAAAYTAVDKAESEPDLAMAINTDAPGVMAEEMKKLGGILIHYSTDYVFDGSKSSPYVESDKTGPLNVYGRSKLAGELAIASTGVAHLIFRTSWVYASRGRNFVLTMLRLAKERDTLAIVNDQYGAPTWARMLAEATAQIIAKCTDRQTGAMALQPDDIGVYHMTAGGRTNWHDFAKFIFRYMSIDKIHLKAISTAAYPTPAQRPTNSVLSNEKLQQHFGISLPDWGDSLRLCLAEKTV